MTIKRTFEEARNRVNKLSDAVFGDFSEVAGDEIPGLLDAAGVNTDEFEDRLYRRLYERAQKYWLAQQALPPLLKKALDDLRPATAPARNEKELAKQAKSVVERAVEQARLLSQLIGGQELSFSSSYRNKSEISTKDKSILDQVQRELREKHNEGKESK
jgi:hypothetical protein